MLTGNINEQTADILILTIKAIKLKYDATLLV